LYLHTPRTGFAVAHNLHVSPPPTDGTDIIKYVCLGSTDIMFFLNALRSGGYPALFISLYITFVRLAALGDNETVFFILRFDFGANHYYSL
jgi:hypothetical protein